MRPSTTYLYVAAANLLFNFVKVLETPSLIFIYCWFISKTRLTSMTLDFDTIYILSTLGLLKEGFDKLRSVSNLTKILWGFHETFNYRISSYSSHPWIVSAPLCTVTFGLIYCDLWISKFKKEYIVSAETIWGNMVDKMQVKTMVFCY